MIEVKIRDIAVLTKAMQCEENLNTLLSFRRLLIHISKRGNASPLKASSSAMGTISTAPITRKASQSKASPKGAVAT